MPPAYVKTIEDELLYEYAKLISRSALGKVNYGFISDRFKALRNGEATISGTIREWEKEQELSRECVFCGATENLQMDHLIPKSRGGSDSADKILRYTCVDKWVHLKYLKLLYDLHRENNTLGVHKDNITQLCPECRNTPTCEEWNKEGKLTCLCLESVF